MHDAFFALTRCISLTNQNHASTPNISFVWLQAFVVFTSSNDALEACKMDKEFFAPEKFDQRYVRVLLAPDLSPESVISGAVIDQQQHTVSTAHQGSHRSNSTSFEQSGLETAIKVSGLPSGMSKAEILQLFWGLQTTPSAMHIQRPASEECNTCDAFIDFGADYIAMQAISSWNGTVITTQDGAFTVTVEKASQLDWNAAHRKSSNGWQTMQSESLVRMRGLPSDVTVTDVQAFFKVCSFYWVGKRLLQFSCFLKTVLFDKA